MFVVQAGRSSLEQSGYFDQEICRHQLHFIARTTAFLSQISQTPLLLIFVIRLVAEGLDEKFNHFIDKITSMGV
jgi:hypothetical protein